MNMVAKINNSTSQQRRQIGYFRHLLKITDELYYEILWNNYKVESSKHLTETQANSLIFDFRNKAIGLGVYKPKTQYKAQKWNYNNLTGRDKDMASPAQLRMVEGMWYKISTQSNDISRQKALNSFIKRITGKDRMNFLSKKDISKLVNAMENMSNK